MYLIHPNKGLSAMHAHAHVINYCNEIHLEKCGNYSLTGYMYVYNIIFMYSELIV